MKSQDNRIDNAIRKGVLILAIAMINMFGFAQDIIKFTDNKELQVKILEINPSTISYRKADTPQGPLYTVRKSAVLKVTYESGLVETFSVSRRVRAKSRPDSLNDRSLDKNGFFVEGLVGVTSYTHRSSSDIYNVNYVTEYSTERRAVATVGMRMGSKFYFGNKSKKYTHGLQMSWLTIHAHLQYRSGINFALFNPGYTGILKLNKKTGMEFNLSTGFNMVARGLDGDRLGPLPIVSFQPAVGYNFNPGVKFRYSGFALGLEYTYSNTISDIEAPSYSTVNVSIGRKF